MSALLLVVGITVTVSALCSLLEATLYSTRVASLEAAQEQGRHVGGARRFLVMKRDITAPTSAILILNTIANTAGAAVAGMLAADALGAGSVPAFSAALTLAILLFSEILPKTFGAIHWRALWPVAIWPLLGMVKMLRPLVWLTQSFAGLFVKQSTGPATTEDEIIAMIRMGANAGELTETEHRLLTAVFRFDEMRAGEVIVPRQEVKAFDASWSVERCLAEAHASNHTRYPLCAGSLDDLVGLIHIKDLVIHAPDSDVDLRTLARPIARVPESVPIRSVMRDMQKSKPHMAAVVNEHGTVVGMITLENILEQLVGSVQDEFDDEDPDLVREGPEAWVARGSVSVDLINQEIGTSLDKATASTLSGQVVAHLGRFPRPGDVLQQRDAVVEVLSVDGTRATRVRIRLAEAEAEAEAEPEADPDPKPPKP